MITDWKGADPTEFKRSVKNLLRLGKVVGDKVYFLGANCQAVADKKKRNISLFQGKRYD